MFWSRRWQLLVEHQEWLPQTVAAATRAPEEETEGGARIDTEVADELRRLNQKIRKLEYQEQIPIFIWAFVGGMLVTVGVMFKLYGMAWIWEEFVERIWEKLYGNRTGWV